MLEALSMETWRWLVDETPYGPSMEYPRWQGIRYIAEVQLDRWHCLKAYHSGRIPPGWYKQQALAVLAAQPFTGLRPEWSEQHHPWG